MKYDLIIWDFNGTILDDVKTGIDSINTILPRYNLPTLDTVDAYREAFGFPIIDYYRALGFDFDKVPYETVAYEWVAEYNARKSTIPLVEGIKKALEGIKALGIKQIILSSSEISLLKEQLNTYGLLSYFSDILGLDNVFAGGKTEIARQWRRSHPDLKTLFIGDTTHDYDVAKAIDSDCILFTGGHGSCKDLSACGVPLVNSITDILRFLS